MTSEGDPPPGDPSPEVEYIAASDEQRLHHERWLEAAVARIWKLIAVLTTLGAVLLLFRGWTWSAGWLLGSAASALNFRWLKQLADALGGPAAKPRKAVFLGLRYAFLGGGAYVILKYSAISLPAALSGLFVSIAAVVLEIIFELAYARNGTLHH